MAPVLFLGRRRITTATSNLGDLVDAAETGRTCATGAPYCHPLASLICVPSRGHELGGTAAARLATFEDLASKLYCRRADSDFACRDWSDRGTAPKHRNAECKSG